METPPKSGAEIVDDFFQSINGREDLHKGVIDVLCKLKTSGKLTPLQISNALEQLRETELNDPN